MADANLINEVVRLVLERLQQMQATPAPTPKPTKPSPAAATLQPLEQAPAAMPRPNAVPASPARKCFVTADDVVARLGGGNSLTLASNERLTPNAMDYVDQHHIKVENPAPASVAAAGQVQPATGMLPAAEMIGVVISGGGQKVASALTALGRDGCGMPRYDQTDCWMRNSSAMLKAIIAGQIGGGVVLVPTGMAATVFANKYRGIRAIQGICTDSVAEGVRELDANVLIVEHGYRSFFEIRTLVKTFIEQRRRPRQTPPMLETITRLEGRA